MHSSSLDYRGAYQLMMPFIFLSALVSVSSRNIACDCYIQHNSRNRPDRGIEGLKKKKQTNIGRHMDQNWDQVV